MNYLNSNNSRIKQLREFPGTPVVRTFTAGAWVQSLVRELRFLKPHSPAKKKRIKQLHTIAHDVGTAVIDEQ